MVMIRNPKSFEVWSACSCNALYVITELEMFALKNGVETSRGRTEKFFRFH
jgi:hypothetical protein